MVSRGRFYSIIIGTFFLNCLLSGTVFAGIFGSDSADKSGLDFTRGYDINTVSTAAGRVVSLPHSGEKENVIVGIRSGNEILNISVGPGAFWESRDFPLSLNDELAVKGSRAQGKDGKSYILTQKLTNRTTGAEVELRSEKGVPVWSGRAMDGSRPERAAGGMRNMGGGMMRSGGGMMRSGGGMMRR